MSYTAHSLVTDRKRKRPSYENSIDEINWTAARCNRLLRTITSRIETLRKLLRPALGNERFQNKQKNAAKKIKREHWSTADPIWLPNGKQLQPRMYFSKAKAAKANARADAKAKAKAGSMVSRSKITVPTPFIKRIRNLDEPVVQHSPAPRQSFPVRMSRQLPIKSGSPVMETEAALDAAFRNVLSITKTASGTPRQGARSLLSSCVRKLPAYAELEADFMSDEQDSDPNVLPELLSYLEDLGVVEGGGWHGLRDAIRALVMHHIEQAIRDGTLSDKCIGVLIDHCDAGSAILEGESLLQTWFDHSEVLTAEHAGHLRHLCSRHNATTVQYRVLNSYARQGPAQILELTKVTMTWNDLLLTVAKGGSSEAIDFLETCIMVCAEQGQHSLVTNTDSDPLLKTLSEVGSKLCMMAMTDILLNEEKSQHQELRDALYRLACRCVLNTPSKAFAFTHSWTLGPALLCFLTSDYPCASKNGISLLDALERVPRLANAAGNIVQKCKQDFATTIAKDIATLEEHTGISIKQLLLQRMLENRPQTTCTIDLARRVAMEIVAVHRQTAGSDQDLYSADLQQIMSMSSTRLGLHTPHQGRKSFRWDETLDEWIARTPFTRATVDSVSASLPVSRSIDDAADVYLPVPELTTPSDDKENGPPQDCAGSELSRSPDVLALSSPVKRVRRVAAVQAKVFTRHSLVDDNFAHPQVIVPRDGFKRRSSGRLSRRLDQPNSDDELGF